MTRHVTVIDGGLSTVLEREGISFENDPLWTSRLLWSNPAAIINVHKSYLASGSDIITTASYQASVDAFEKNLNISATESIGLIKLSVDLANQARDEYSRSNVENSCRQILIAGSIGPHGASLADGSEYSGSYCDTMSEMELLEWHRPRMKTLIDAGVDVLAMETIPAVKEGQALIKLLREFPNMRAWLSFSCQSPHEDSYEEPIGPAAKHCLQLASHNQLIAIGVNCCKPSYVSSLLKDISSSVSEFPLIAYPNSGESWNSSKGWSNSKEKPISTYVESWIKTSAEYVGGCCRTGPDDIAQIVQILKGRGI